MSFSRAQLEALHRANPRVAAAGMREAERDDQKALRNRLDARKTTPTAQTGQNTQDLGRQHAAGEKTGHYIQTPPQPEIRQFGEVRFTIPGNPIGKPRMVHSDKWAKRPAVLRWIAWKDAARPHVPALPVKPYSLDIVAYFERPASWGKKKRLFASNMPHRQKPDFDNVSKLVSDFLFSDDSIIWKSAIEKRWDDGGGPRLIITVK